jgi:3-hydroxyacyl-CoA dehydrogenase
MNRLNIQKIAVLGAGVMGAQIAAHFVNMNVSVMLFDLPPKEGAKNAIASRAIDDLKKLKPAPLGLLSQAALIEPANYEEHLPALKGCDLIIEAIAERMDYKLELYTKIAPFIAPHALLASNTSGLSIGALAQALPSALRNRFCGIHFFNPPRYMHLVELIATPLSEPALLDQLETFVTSVLGKGVVRAKDTPNFIANRVGVANMLSSMIEAEKYGLSYEVVDELTGRKLGRASSGTFRTADVVGLDTLAHVINTLQTQLKTDPFAATYATPPVLARLIAAQALGQKSGAGFYKKVGKDILRLDVKNALPGAQLQYVPTDSKVDDIMVRILKKPAPERLKLLRESTHPQAQFVWAILRNSFHYAAVHLKDIAHCARDIDLAFRWGFGASLGPFELWQQAGWRTLAQWVKEDIDAGNALCGEPLPSWVFDGRQGVHSAAGSWSAAQGADLPPSTLPVYQRQHFAQTVWGSPCADPLTAGTEILKNADMRIWSPDGQVLIASLTAKLHLISPTAVEALHQAITVAEEGYKALIIWSPDDVFSAGANLEALMPVFMQHGAKGIEPEVKKLQDALMRLRYASVPVVAAMRGLALGGGCELALHCAMRVSTLENYMGLVEVGVGLLPAGGGLTYLARRAAQLASAINSPADLLTFLREGLTQVATAKVSTSALEARQMGYLQAHDVLVPHADELLHVAMIQAQALFESGYRPPAKAQFAVAGRMAKATIEAQLVNLREGGFASEHDVHIGTLIAQVLCGGDVDAGTLVNEAYLLQLERQHFCALLAHPKTQARIMGMLSSGKPVRN